ncbi:MAG: DUF2817 domain-containing protein [Planctomycetota bacterium]
MRTTPQTVERAVTRDLAALAVLWLLCGCAGIPQGSSGNPGRSVPLGRSVEGRAIEAVVFQGRPGAGCTLVLGGIHGNEPASAALVQRLAEHMRDRPAQTTGRTVVLIPRANPDGLAAGTRHNARGVDLNRNFRTRNFEPGARRGQKALSEPESRAIAGAVARWRPSCIVSVHGPLNGIDPDGGERSTRLARRMAALSPLPYRDLRAMPGSLGTWGGVELGRKMITYELDRKKLPATGRGKYLQSHLAALLLAIREG